MGLYGIDWLEQIQLTSIKFNMSLKTVQPTFIRRTSERRRLKMLRNLDEYKISNPFKSQRQIPNIPDDLAQQLKKVQYLSATSISLISFPTSPLQVHNHQSSLNQMREAILNQQHRMHEVIGEPDNISFDNSEVMEEEEVSLDLKGGHCAGEEVITTREQLSINFMNIQENYFPPRDFEEEHLNMLESQPHSQIFRHANSLQEDHLIIDQDYQRYFNN